MLAKIGRVLSIISCVLIVFVAVYLAIFVDGGYIKDTTPKIIQDKTIADEPKDEAQKQVERLQAQVGEVAEKQTSKLYASKCSSCHGKNGDGRVNEKGEVVFPKIRGLEMAHILKKLDFYKNDRSKNPLMRGLLTNLDDGALKELAEEISKM